MAAVRPIAPETSNKVTFPTGAERGTEAIKGWYMLSQIALRRYCNAMQLGTVKYKPFNYLKGIPATNLIEHLYTHLSQFLQGDASEDHLGHALWNLASLIHFSETRLDLFEGLPPGCKEAMVEWLQNTDEGLGRNDAVNMAQALDQSVKATVEKLAASLPSREEKLQAFKTYVHQYLTNFDVPENPGGPHTKEGCRIGDRLDWLINRLTREDTFVPSPATSRTIEQCVDAAIEKSGAVGYAMTHLRDLLLAELSSVVQPQEGEAAATCEQGEQYGICKVHPPCKMVSGLIEDLNDRIDEQNRQYNDAQFPVYQACEACGPAVLDESGKCPKCKQVYDFKRWMSMSMQLRDLERRAADAAVKILERVGYWDSHTGGRYAEMCLRDFKAIADALTAQPEAAGEKPERGEIDQKRNNPEVPA